MGRYLRRSSRRQRLARPAPPPRHRHPDRGQQLSASATRPARPRTPAGRFASAAAGGSRSEAQKGTPKEGEALIIPADTRVPLRHITLVKAGEITLALTPARIWSAISSMRRSTPPPLML